MTAVGNGGRSEAGRAPRLRLDDRRVWLPASVEPGATYDVVINDQHVWSVQPARDATGPVGHQRVEWPKALRRYLRGRADVVLREHVGGQVLARTAHVFGDDSTTTVDVTDQQGNPLILDKWGRLIRPLASDTDELVDELMVRLLELMEAIRSGTGLPVFVCYGTLLGAVRDQAFIGHDNDVDIAYASAETHPVDIVREGFRVERALHDAGWTARRGSGVRLNVPITLSDGSVRRVDVFSANWVEDVLYIPSDLGVRLPREQVLPLGTVTLHGREVPAPNDPESMLRATYGESWRVPDPSFRYESPKSLRRRFSGWYGGLVSGRKHWDAFGARAAKLVPDEPTPFARWVAENYPSSRPVVDLGAGTGRDSLWFAESCGRPCTAVDYSPRSLTRTLRQHRADTREEPVTVENLNLHDLRAVLALGARLSRTEEPVDLYARFLLHAIHPQGREHVFRLASMALRRGGFLFVEFRTPKDRRRRKVFRGPRHYLSARRVRSEIERAGGRVVHQTRGTGLASFQDEDPHVCRMVATWSQ